MTTGDRSPMSSPMSSPMCSPMLATLTRQLPLGDYRYEPKWDGFRCIAERDGDSVRLTSRNGRPLARYFPELVEALLAIDGQAYALDGEIVAEAREGDGELDFAALMLRLHPSPSRVERLRRQTPATLMAFDLLAVGERDVRQAPLAERRQLLAELLAAAPPAVRLSPQTDDAAVAEQWLAHRGSGIDGVVAKLATSVYEPGKRAKSWLKVKAERTADCVVGGFRAVDDAPLVASLLLGLYDEAGVLRHTGVASSFSTDRRRELAAELDPYVTALAGHPWEHGFALERGPMGRLKGAAGAWDPRSMPLDWVPVRPELVCEVAYDQVDATGRWRHPTRFVRWRPDRDPRSCTTDQFRAA